MSSEDIDLSFEESYSDSDDDWLPEDFETSTDDENNEPLYQLDTDRAK